MCAPYIRKVGTRSANAVRQRTMLRGRTLRARKDGSSCWADNTIGQDSLAAVMQETSSGRQMGKNLGAKIFEGLQPRNGVCPRPLALHFDLAVRVKVDALGALLVEKLPLPLVKIDCSHISTKGPPCESLHAAHAAPMPRGCPVGGEAHLSEGRCVPLGGTG